MKESIFRKKSIERISSPEEIDEYIKVTSPSMWLILAAIFCLLAAMFFWGITGEIEAKILENGTIVNKTVAPISFLID